MAKTYSSQCLLWDTILSPGQLLKIQPSRIVRANYNTQFAQTAPELTNFRLATANLIDGMDDDALSDTFRNTVNFTTYDSYTPFIARFFEKPCKANAVVDLLAPGLPDYLAESSSTSGGHSKTFPKYKRLSPIRSSGAGSRPISNSLRRRTTAYVCYLWCDQMCVEVGDGDKCTAATIYLACGSVADRRTEMYLDPEKDREKMGSFIYDHAAPYAAGFIKKWRSFLLVHVLFAVGSKSLETMLMLFVNTFVDMMRLLDAEFEMIVDCIERGIIPDLDGVAEVQHYLEPNISPDPERAAELRSLGRPSSRPGWCSHVWPNLRSITGGASGTFALSVPLAQWYLGPNAHVCSIGYGSTEGWVGSAHNPLELNLFKPGSKNLVEFLDISKGDDSISAVAQLWEVEVGKRYELVLTTPDGLWRYRLGDVVEIAGFDSADGTPVFRFLERRNVVIRFPDFMVTEKELRAALSSASLGNFVDWTTTIDNRHVPDTIGFFVELADDQLSDLTPGVPDEVLDILSRSNENIDWAFAHGLIRKPTIRLVRSGTFSAFRQLKLDEGCGSLGQIKVPVVLPKPAYVTWFSNQVVHEL